MANEKLAYVNVGPGGTFRGSGAVQTLPSDVDEIVRHLSDTTRHGPPGGPKNRRR